MRKRGIRSHNTKKKEKRSNFQNPLKPVLRRILPFGFPLIFFGCLVFFLSKAAFHFLTHSPYFSIETVEASSSFPNYRFRDPSWMGSLLGRNIFSEDLGALQEELSRKHPELLDASVSREFPNRIRIHLTPRLPVAEVQSDENFLMDREGIPLPDTHLLQQEKLPVIIGASLHSEGFMEALAFLKSLDELPELKRYVRNLDVSDENNLSFLTPEGLEVRVGKGEYLEKLKLFDRTRVTLGDRINEVKYIDLRFDDVVIGSR